jgi:uncharacterized repeat protein (TIGR03803 family)
MLSLAHHQSHPVIASGWKLSLRLVTAALAVCVSLSLSDVYIFAQTLTVLHTFNQGDGESPNGALFRDSAGNLYGTTTYGGKSGFGTVYKLDVAGNFSKLYQFAGSPSDGAYPNGSLTHDAAGNFYGTTSQGGATNAGTIFMLNTHTGKETVLYSFVANSSDGMWPYTGLTRDAVGNFYGVASVDGLYGGGIVFKLDRARTVHILHNFSGNSTDGLYPYGVLLLSKGKLHGTTSFGGTSNLGTVFVIDQSGETVLFDFAGTAGEFPFAGLITDAAGNFYGTTQYGGDLSCNALSSGCGTVFKLDANGNQTVLYSFLGSPDGDDAAPGLVLDPGGNLYGATAYGGAGTCQNSPFIGCGTLFKVDQNGHETVLFNFTGGADGKYPFGTLIRDSGGNLYGSATQGGSGCHQSGCGTVFKLTP